MISFSRISLLLPICLLGILYLEATGAEESQHTEKEQPRIETKTQSRKITKTARAAVEGYIEDVDPEAARRMAGGEAVIQDENVYIQVDEEGREIVNEPADLRGSTELVLPEINKTPRTVPYRSISSSKQFIVIGEDRKLCSAISSQGDQIKNEILDILQERDDWKGTITVEFAGKSGDPVVTEPIVTGMNIIDGHAFFHIRVLIGQGIDQMALRMEITKAYMYERSVRNLSIDLIPDTMRLPAWILTGLNETILWKKEQGDRNLYATLFERGDIFTLDELFKVDNPFVELDASTLGIYRASSGALMMSLLNQAGGKEAFKRMLDQSIFSSIDGETLLKQNFPGLHLSKNSLYKWWALQLSKMAMQPMTESLTALETERLLEEYSQVPYYDSELQAVIKIGPQNYKVLMAMPVANRNALLQPMLANLVQLSYRCFPMQRPLVVETIRLVESIVKGRVPRNMDERLEELRKERILIDKVGNRSRDYLDWFTIVTATRTMGTFDSYIRAMSLLREKNQRPDNEMTRYLDDIEKLISKGN